MDEKGNEISEEIHVEKDQIEIMLEDDLKSV